ncbi:MAG: hypothetical protein GX496_06200 [Firmicutes bacterium]|nr:hypothetical protein [Bacillota bacterium]
MEKLLTPATLGLLAAVALLAYLVTRRGFFATTATFAASENNDSEWPLVWVRPGSWPCLASPNRRVRVYWEPPVAETVAQAVLTAATRVDEILDEVFPGLRRPRLRLTLLADCHHPRQRVAMTGFGLHAMVDTAHQEAWIASHRAREFLFSVVPHEWVEAAVALRLYWRDRKTRWVGEGAADYAAYRVGLALAPEVARARLAILAERLGPVTGTECFDLTDFRVATQAQPGKPTEAQRRARRGYAVSFALFYWLAERRGPAEGARLLAQAMGGSWPTGARARRAFERALGSDGPALTAVPLAWVAERLQEAARALPAHP